ncbi:MFS transporter [Acidobacteria bacterium AB60]|nr:MFS transporter [Acidobacteria bacterium AB60]
MSAPTDLRELLPSAIGRASRRLVPFLVIAYIVSFLDRANVAFAKEALGMTRGISEQAYALGAGLFFLSYSTCGFPSNLILHRIGARRWISTLLIAWGLVSAATIFIQGPVSFYGLRLLLGVTEAGFFPGIILYLTYWFPEEVRGRIMGLFYLGVPIALIVGGPLSGVLLDLNVGLQGWQWMFLVEGLLASGVGVLALTRLPDRPHQARWLPEGERQALLAQLEHESAERRVFGPVRAFSIFQDWNMLRFVLIYALIQVSTYGVVFYLPTEIGTLLHRRTGAVVGIVSAIPWIFAALAVYLLPHLADTRRQHRLVASITLGTAGIAGLVFPTAGPGLGLVTLSIAASAFVAVQPVFWTFPTSYLADVAAAGGIALIGAGNLGGFIAPNLKVWADRFFGTPFAGLYLLATLALLNAGLVATLRRPQRPPRR